MYQDTTLASNKKKVLGNKQTIKTILKYQNKQYTTLKRIKRGRNKQKEMKSIEELTEGSPRGGPPSRGGR